MSLIRINGYVLEFTLLLLIRTNRCKYTTFFSDFQIYLYLFYIKRLYSLGSLATKGSSKKIFFKIYRERRVI